MMCVVYKGNLQLVIFSIPHYTIEYNMDTMYPNCCVICRYVSLSKVTGYPAIQLVWKNQVISQLSYMFLIHAYIHPFIGTSISCSLQHRQGRFIFHITLPHVSSLYINQLMIQLKRYGINFNNIYIYQNMTVHVTAIIIMCMV